MRKFLIGVLVGCLLMMTTPVLADSILQSIDVVLDNVQVQVNGEKLDVNTILYNGSTYLPMRKVAEAVGKEVNWNQETMTANIIEKKDGDNMATEITTIEELTYNEFIGMFDKRDEIDDLNNDGKGVHIRHYIYNGNLLFEELRTLLHGQSDNLLQDFAEQIMETEFKDVGNKNTNGYVILFNYDYLEDSLMGKNTIIQFEQKKGFNNDEINIWKPIGIYEK